MTKLNEQTQLEIERALAVLPPYVREADNKILRKQSKQILGTLLLRLKLSDAKDTGRIFFDNKSLRKFAHVGGKLFDKCIKEIELTGLVTRIKGVKRVDGSTGRNASEYIINWEAWKKPVTIGDLFDEMSEKFEVGVASTLSSSTTLSSSSLTETVSETVLLSKTPTILSSKTEMLTILPSSSSTINTTNVEVSPVEVNNNQEIFNNKNILNNSFNKEVILEEPKAIEDSDVEEIEEILQEAETSTLESKNNDQNNNFFNNFNNDIDHVEAEASVSLSVSERSLSEEQTEPSDTVTMTASDYAWKAISAVKEIRGCIADADKAFKLILQIRELCKRTLITSAAAETMFYVLQNTANFLNMSGVNHETHATDKETLTRGVAILEEYEQAEDYQQKNHLKNRYINAALNSKDPYTAMALLTKFRKDSVLGELKTEEELTRYMSTLPDKVTLKAITQ